MNPVDIRIDTLTKMFGDIPAVDNVSLQIAPGELFFLLGPSGCGKTTLLRCLAGFHEPDSGSLHIGGEDITRRPPHRRQTAMVFQNYALWPHLSVLRNVSFGLEMRGMKKAEVRRQALNALALVRMESRADARPNQLSGGQQQRVALARALVTKPRCLLLDEPLSNLDAKLRIEMREEIRQLCKSAGLTAVYVTHDQKEALSTADRIAVMREGTIQQIATPEELYRRPKSRFVAEFLGEINLLEGQVLEREGETSRVETPLGVLSIGIPAPHPPPAARLELGIRPEAVHLGEQAPGNHPNVFRGNLRHSLYQGETARHELTLDAGGASIALNVFELNPRRYARAEACIPTYAWIDPEDIIPLRDSNP